LSPRRGDRQKRGSSRDVMVERSCSGAVECITAYAQYSTGVPREQGSHTPPAPACPGPRPARSTRRKSERALGRVQVCPRVPKRVRPRAPRRAVLSGEAKPGAQGSAPTPAANIVLPARSLKSTPGTRVVKRARRDPSLTTLRSWGLARAMSGQHPPEIAVAA
jgi:hypothetical protein